MKKLLLFIFITYSICNNIFAQLHDNNSVIQPYGKTKDPQFWITILNFDKNKQLKFINPPKKSKMSIYQTVSSMSDKNGNLAFYTNGQYLENMNYDTIQNSELFYPGEDINTLYQGCLVLPFPEKDSMYLVMAQDLGFKPSNYYGAKKFHYGVVDMSLNGGKGKMISKGIEVMEKGKYASVGKLTAVKKANGKDWWIIFNSEGLPPEAGSNIFYCYQLTKDGLSFVATQAVAQKVPEGVGTAEFSPDGTKYAIYNYIGPSFNHYLHVFDFDRCTGLLTNQKSMLYTDLANNGVGVAFSPNSRYLYMGLNKKLMQYDMQAKDLKTGEKLVAKIKGIATCKTVITEFGNMQLAPNGKIYIAGQQCAKAYHIIHEPNKPDTLCNVEQAGLKLPTYYDATMNKFPNFQLGKMDCTVGTSEAEEINDISLYPNPANGLVYLNIDNLNPNVENKLILSDITGGVKNTFDIVQGQNSFDIGNFQNGIYICTVISNSKVIYTQKLVVLK